MLQEIGIYNPFRYKHAVQAINMFAKNGKISKTKVLKLLFLSDRMHFKKYGATITGSTYGAWKMGPVSEKVKTMIESAADSEDDPVVGYMKEYLSIERDSDDPKKIYLESIKDTDEKNISETHEEILFFIQEKFGLMTVDDLIAFTHKLPEYNDNYEKNQEWKEIPSTDFLKDSGIPDDQKTTDYVRDMYRNIGVLSS